MAQLLNPIRVAIDGNEANTSNRVGSNVYAFEILRAMEEITRTTRKDYEITVLLSGNPVEDWPAARPGWNYQIVGPKSMWTQWAEPLFLERYYRRFEVFYTPGHYAPRFLRLPYITSVMDLAFLEFPEQFKRRDLIQLTEWTRYSVQKADKVVAISKFTKNEIVKHYQKPSDDILVAPPGVSLPPISLTYAQERALVKSLGVTEDYFLYVGTIQPRKNLPILIRAFEDFCATQPTHATKKIQLVIAGKVGWLANDTLATVAASPVRDQIILPGFVSDEAKVALLRHCLGNYNLGLYEGFGIPALEALALDAIPVVANNTSLPEVVGNAGVLVDPTDQGKITWSMQKLQAITPSQKKVFEQHRAKQLTKYSYEKSALTLLKELKRLARP